LLRPPDVVTSGSQDLAIGGRPAARQDRTKDGDAIVEGSKGVFINGKPAATAKQAAALRSS
jgi:uncharacterized Zn-binding protein involved in type VI secretion